jgi:hypothetical protein
VNVPLYADVRLHDGSLVRMALIQDQLDVQTKYGKLQIPIAEVRSIEFGQHLPVELAEQLDHHIQLLGVDNYRQREEASRELLQAGHWAYSKLRLASQNSDVEVSQRAASLMRQIAKRFPMEHLKRQEQDVIHTIHFKVVGRIQNKSLKARSNLFGASELPLCELSGISVRGYQSPDQLLVDAARHGSASNQWLDTGILIDPHLRLSIKGTGQVDLYPQEPGQYLARPDGYGTMGRDSAFPAGALVGRIGESGRVFLIGECYQGTPGEQGKLYLHIVPSPWNNGSAGLYRVTLRTDHVEMTTRRD